MHQIQEFLSHLDPAIARYGTPLVAILVFGESFGLPLPGESVVIASGLAARRGDLAIVPLFLAVWFAAVAGDSTGYAIGHFGGRPLLLRLGTKIGVTEERLRHVEGFFRRYGAWVIVVARFIVVLRQLNGLVAGMTRMPFLHFLVANAVGGVLWAGVWCLGTYLVGKIVF